MDLKVYIWEIYRLFIKYCVFSKDFRIFRTWSFSVFPWVQCVYTHQAGRTPTLQQNWQSSEKSQHFREKTQYLMNTLYLFLHSSCELLKMIVEWFKSVLGQALLVSREKTWPHSDNGLKDGQRNGLLMLLKWQYEQILGKIVNANRQKGRKEFMRNQDLKMNMLCLICWMQQVAVVGQPG